MLVPEDCVAAAGVDGDGGIAATEGGIDGDGYQLLDRGGAFRRMVRGADGYVVGRDKGGPEDGV